MACWPESSQGEEGDHGLMLNVGSLWFFLGLQGDKTKSAALPWAVVREVRLNAVSSGEDRSPRLGVSSVPVGN